jgi:hypothetical protein
MKLLYINQIETNAGWGLETFINKSLIANGIETICVDYQKNAYALANELLKIESDFDAVLLERGCGCLIPIEILNSIDRPKIFLFTELVARNVNQHYLLNTGIFDYIFFRSIPCMDLVVKQDWIDRSRIGLFLSAIEPDFHQPIEGTIKDIDILFIGTLLPRRQKIIDELARNFTITTRSAFGREMVELINRAKIVLNIHGEDFLDTETRVYETLACRGFLLTEKLSPENPFQDGIHLVEAQDIADLTAKIAYYLNNDLLRERIAEAGYQEVIDRHTFARRAKQIEQAIESYLSTEKIATDPLMRAKLQRCAQWEVFYQVRDETWLLTRKYLSVVKQTILKKILKRL